MILAETTRRLLRTPVATVTQVLLLAIGGAALFTAVSISARLDPGIAGLRAQEGTFQVAVEGPTGLVSRISGTDSQRIRDELDLPSDKSARLLLVETMESERTIVVEAIDRSYLDIMGLTVEGLDAPLPGVGGTLPAIVSGPLWDEIRGGPWAVGETITSGAGVTFHIVGVFPEYSGFANPQGKPMMAIPIDQADAVGFDAETVDQVGTLLFVVGQGIPESIKSNATGKTLRFEKEIGIPPSVMADVRTLQRITYMGGTALMVVVLVNLLSNLLSSSVERIADVKIKAALGARTGQLLVGLLAQPVVIGLLAGLVTIAGAVALSGVLLESIDYIEDYYTRPSPIEALFIGMAMPAVAMLAGLIPATMVLRTIRRGELGLRVGTVARVLQVFGVAQVGAAAITISMAWLMLHTLREAAPDDFPYNYDLTLIHVDGEFDENSRRINRERYTRLQSEVVETTDYESAAYGAGIFPLPIWQLNASFGSSASDSAQYGPIGYVSTGFLDTLGIELLRGRDFEESDFTLPAGAPRPAIVNPLLCRELFATDNCIGMAAYASDFFTYQFHQDRERRYPFEVVGMIPDFPAVRGRAMQGRLKPAALFPNTGMRGAVFFLKGDGDAQGALRVLRKAVDSPTQTVKLLGTVDRIMRDETRTERAIATTAVATAVATALLAAAGVYTILMLYGQAQRRALSIRLAVGARRRHVVMAMAGYVLPIVALGLIPAVPTVIIAVDVLDDFLIDAATQLTAALVLGVGVTIFLAAACAMPPIVRALRVDIAGELRSL